MNAITTIPYDPQPKQALAHGVAAKQIMYGGAAMGGKSAWIRWDMVRFCLANPGLEAYLFRRTFGELEKNHIRPLKRDLMAAGIPYEYNADHKRFVFPNQSSINCCYCENEDDVTRYQGAEFHYLGVDEAAHLTEYQLTYLRSRVRLGNWVPAPEYAAFLPRIAFTSNPGGPGHNFIKHTFISPSPPETIFFDTSTQVKRGKDVIYPGHTTIYIRARMSDNKYATEEYEGQFSAMEPELARALRDGDWDAIVGKAIHNLSRDRHQLRQFDPPKHWTRFMVIDWGTAKPFCVLWCAVSEGAILAPKEGWPERWLPSGAVVVYREWYGWDGKPDKGCRMAAPAVARRILEIEDKEVMDYRVGDSQTWAQHDGPSVQENMMTATEGRITLRRSVKDRVQNYAEIIARLAGNPRFIQTGETIEDPMLFITANCVHVWRTVPTLILDQTNPEKGPDTDQEDHSYDCLAYGCRSRPFVSTEEDRFMAEHGDEMRAALRKNTDPYATGRAA